MTKSKSGSRKGNNSSLKTESSKHQALSQTDNFSSKVCDNKNEEVSVKDLAKVASSENLDSATPPDILVNPVFTLQQALENKLRNLNKRKQKLQQMKENESELTPEQLIALSKLDEINVQIEFVKEMQMLGAKQLKQYKKAVRRRDYDEAEKRSKTASVAPSIVSTNEGEDRNSPEEELTRSQNSLI